MKKGKVSKVRVGVVLDSEIKGLVEVLKRLPDDWEVIVAPTSRLADIINFRPHVIVFRGSLVDPVIGYLRELKVPKLILLPLGQTEYWDTIALEPDWFVLGSGQKKAVADNLKNQILNIL